MRLVVLVSILVFADCSSSCGQEKPGKENTEAFIAWQDAWNSSESNKLIALFHRESITQRARQRLSLWKSGFGEISKLKQIASYEDGAIVATRIDFKRIKNFPVVFFLKKADNGMMFVDFLPGRDPTLKGNAKEIQGFLKSWQACWDGGGANQFMEKQHPSSCG